jgi:hypothetical protein
MFVIPAKAGALVIPANAGIHLDLKDGKAPVIPA